jgi:MoaA/NifB/PqqE/SkfB family radical SAM enzyme/SAM-dependent methyltransferase
VENKLENPWNRIEYNNIPIYVNPEVPDWFVPNSSCDQMFSKWLKTGDSSNGLKNFLPRINGTKESKYKYRTEKLELDTLKECWIHVTNRCNMECRHCMFKSSPFATEELSIDECDNVVQEAYALGCRIFFFTGGEPFLSKAFIKSVRDILNLADTHVVVLTNLTLISKAKNWISTLPKERLHFQVSLDGMEENHDYIRGKKAFSFLTKNLKVLRELGFPVTLSTTITVKNVVEMEEIVEFASEQNISNVHFLWLFKKGNADNSLFVAPDLIFKNLVAAHGKAVKKGVKIDNIEIYRSQVFSFPGTQYNLSNAGWQSLSIGPNGYIYPTPALIYTKEMESGHINDGLESVWKNSSTLASIRKTSLNQCDIYSNNPFKYIVGGGDIDHSYINSGDIVGGDPYVELYTNIVKWLITSEADRYNLNGNPAIKLKMGEILGDCPAEGSGGIFFTHSNCVQSLPGQDTHTQVNHFYSEAAKETKEDILNPVCYDEHLVRHIPEQFRLRSYGCGSPVLEADVRHSETLVDLGSGTGIECFIASKMAGPHGKVIGIDMGDTMLDIANTTKESVITDLKYDNVSFKKAFLEELPLESGTVDIVISNCVVNLSPNKRQVFQEIFRVLKPGGRLLISDITYDGEIPLDIKYNETLRGECIGGALNYKALFGLINDIGFSQSHIVKGYLYRNVKGHDFYSITYSAVKPEMENSPVLYDFPDFEQIMSEVESQPSCACFTPPEKRSDKKSATDEPHMSGCMVCGSDLIYQQTNKDMTCSYCEGSFPSGARCKKGHFVCDTCHSSDAIGFIRQVLIESRDDDAVSLMQKVRSHPKFPIHGPEHHSLLPAVILTALRNSGEEISFDQIDTAIERGQSIAGGACAFFGACGAAIGVGIALSVLTGATPLDGGKRQLAQLATQNALGEIAEYDVPRCCQRDLWLALQSASKFLEEKMDKKLKVDFPLKCEQFSKNKECIFKECPLWSDKKI